MSGYLIFIKIGVALAALTALYLWGWHGGSGHTQRAWDSAQLVQAHMDTEVALAFAKAAKAALDAQDAATELNGRIENDLLPKLAGSDARATALTRLLYAARENAAGHSPLPSGADRPGPAPASGGASSEAEIERLSGDVRSSEAAAWAAGERDGTRLDGLIAEIKPQL